MNKELFQEPLTSYTCSKCGRQMKTNGPIPVDSICDWCQLPEKKRKAIVEQMKQDTTKNLNWDKK